MFFSTTNRPIDSATLNKKLIAVTIAVYSSVTDIGAHSTVMLHYLWCAMRNRGVKWRTAGEKHD